MSTNTSVKNPRKKKQMPLPQTPEEMQTSLRQLFLSEIKDMYWAEKHLVKALSKMQKAAFSVSLKRAIAKHLEQTETHVARLEQVFELIGEKARAKKCDAMEGLVQEGEGVIEDTDEGTSTRDVGLILAAQKVEHYEIAAYGGLTHLAKSLLLNEVADVLSTTLVEEKETDMLLTQIAENEINYEASIEN
jgi:ferritin-like metal-binding protein YciE